MSIPSFVASTVRRRRHSLLLGSADYTGSTLTSSVFAVTANGSATTTLTATVYRDGVLSAGEQVTYTVQRIQMNAADSFISASPSDIASDGVETSTITVQAAYNQNGEYVALPGIPAASVVLAAATTTGNTLVQPAAATDANGVATGTIKTTDAATSKTISATIAGLAVTDTAIVTTDGGYVPPAPGTPFFEDNFAGTQFNNDNGFVWGAVNDTAVVSFDGYNALRFRYNSGVQAEQRFDLGQQLTELWIDYDLYVPANYVKGPSNDKAIRIWGNNYNAANKVGASMWYDTGYADDVSVKFDRGVSGGIGPSTYLGQASPTSAWGVTLGAWNRVRWHFKMCASDSTGMELEMWIGNTLQLSWTSNVTTIYDSTYPYWDAGYLLGYANGGFTEQTDFYVKAIKFYNTDPGW